MSKTTLRNVIDEHVERAFVAGATWALVRTGVDSLKAEKLVRDWFRDVRVTDGSLPIIRQSAQDSICRALLTATIDQTAVHQEQLI